jgi:hypothetical protein
MSQAIWILQYDLTSGSEYEYLNWFHNIHIPEKLGRPGYLWSVHYQGQIGALDHSDNRRSYLALFGGISTRTFLNPSPSELRGMQDDLTKEMMEKRLSSKGNVFALEWSVDELKNVQEPRSQQLDFFFIRADGNDEEVGAWAAKSLSSLSKNPELNDSKTYKLISVTGGHFHGILHDAGSHHPIDPNKKLCKPQTAEFLRDLAIEHFNGQRIWPPENSQ